MLLAGADSNIGIEMGAWRDCRALVFDDLL